MATGTAGAAAVVGLLWFVYNYVRLVRFERTTGSIVEYVAQKSENGLTLWRMVFEFQARDQKRYTINSSAAFFPRPIEPVGSPVQIKYPPSRPTKADLFEENTTWFLPITLLLSGCAVVLYQLVHTV